MTLLNIYLPHDQGEGKREREKKWPYVFLTHPAFIFNTFTSFSLTDYTVFKRGDKKRRGREGRVRKRKGETCVS